MRQPEESLGEHFQCDKSNATSRNEKGVEGGERREKKMEARASNTKADQPHMQLTEK